MESSFQVRYPFGNFTFPVHFELTDRRTAVLIKEPSCRLSDGCGLSTKRLRPYSIRLGIDIGLIHEFVDLLGFLFEIEKYEKNNHRHIVDIPRIIFFA